MIEFKHIENSKITVLETFGHNGVDWLHSLLDCHHQLLIIPAFSFFRTINVLLTKLNETSIEELNNSKISNTLSDMFLNDPSYQYQRRKFIFSKDEGIKFESFLFKYLQNSKITPKNKCIFFGIHYAFAKIKDIDLSQVKSIVAHEHVPWYSEKYEVNFDVKFIFMMRDPRAAIAGSWLRQKVGEGSSKKWLKNSANSEYSKILSAYRFDMTLYFWRYSEFFVNKNHKDFASCMVVKNEDMHSNLILEMKKIALWIGIDFNDSMLNATFGGKQHFGESVYLAVDDLSEPPPDNYYLPNEIEKRWMSVLSASEIIMIEALFRKIFIKYGYKLKYKSRLHLKIISIIRWTFSSVFNQNYKLYLLPIVYVRNIIRRLCIMFAPKIAYKIFKIL